MWLRPPATSRGATAHGDRGFALLVVLIVLTALYIGATGVFLAARAELRIGTSHVASSRSFYLAEAGLTTWLASNVQPVTASYVIGGETVSVRATRLIRVDSVTVLYDVVASVRLGGSQAQDAGSASRVVGVLGSLAGTGPVRRIHGSWREVL
jgi:type II secretory pathway component PulK